MPGISPKFPSLGVIAIRALIFSETERPLVPGAKLVPCVCIAADHIRGPESSFEWGVTPFQR